MPLSRSEPKNMMHLLIYTLLVCGATFGAPSSNQQVCDTSLCKKIADTLSSEMNMTADPCDDFYQFTCGNWIANEKSPLARKFTMPDEILKERMKEILDANLDNEYPPIVFDAQRFFRLCEKIDIKEDKLPNEVKAILEKKLTEMGGWPLITPDWNEDGFSIENALIYLNKNYGIFPLFQWEFQPTEENSTNKVDLSLDNAYEQYGRLFSTNDSAAEDIRDLFIVSGFQNTVESFVKSFVDDETSEDLETDDQIEELIEFVKSFSALVKPTKLDDEVIKQVATIPLDDVQSKFETLDWRKIIQSSVGDFNVTKLTEAIMFDSDAIKKAGSLIRKTSKRTIANYIGWQFLAKYLERLIDCQEGTVGSFAHALGRVYVDKYIDDDTLEDVKKMVKALRKSFDQLLDENEWMDELTKKRAKNKLKQMKENIAYPEFYKDNEKLQSFYKNLNLSKNMEAVDLLSNLDAILEFETKRKVIDVVGNQLDYVWLKGTLQANAGNLITSNSMAIYAGILIQPAYLRNRPIAMNYGSLGYVVGHEFTHAFDSNGRYFDENGELQNWWTNASLAEYKKREECFLRRYSEIVENSSDITEYARFTSGEDIADGGGIREAFRAFKMLQKEDPKAGQLRLPGEMSKYTPEQLFFIAFGNQYCQSSNGLMQIISMYLDEHSADRNRVIGTLMSSADFSEAFKCPKDAKMNPAKKCIIVRK